MHSSDEGIKKDSEREAAVQTTPLPAIHQQPSYNVYPVPMATNANFIPGSVPVLPLLLPWQHAQVPQANLFNAHHYTTHDTNNRRATKKEPWFKKFNYRYNTCALLLVPLLHWLQSNVRGESSVDHTETLPGLPH